MVAISVAVKSGGFFGAGCTRRMPWSPSSSKLEKAGIPIKAPFRRDLNLLSRFRVTC